MFKSQVHYLLGCIVYKIRIMMTAQLVYWKDGRTLKNSEEVLNKYSSVYSLPFSYFHAYHSFLKSRTRKHST